MNQHTKRVLPLESSDIRNRNFTPPLVMEYVAGADPYVWFGDNEGWCFATVDASKLRSFLRGISNQEGRPDA